MLLLADVLKQVRNAEIIYPQPMLEGQVSYLYNMVSSADQAPGVEATDRFGELTGRFAQVKALYNGD